MLAIDASIWLTQFLKAMRDPDTGSVKPAAHLIGFFRRLAKLRFHGIRPILVFDGATPIIKLRELEQRRRRREQFAPNSAGAVQRLAKRLLLQEIKKVKHAKAPQNGGSAAPGFNLPEEKQQGTDLASADADGEVGIQTTGKELEASSEEVARVLQEDEWRHQTEKEKSLPPSSTLESSEEIARALQKEEWQGEQLVQGDDKLDESDWDKPISDLDQHEPTKTSKGLKKHFQGKDKYDIEYIASLDPHNRKDAIEDAKRKQRMRSRQEFMPVAGQPEEYSAAQVRNFLRSTRLNKDIVKIAQQEAQKKASAGSAVASDPSRRVIFEKLDNEPKPTASRRLTRKQYNAEEESDSELEWEESDEDTVPQSKKRAILVDSSDEDDQVIVERKQLNGISKKDENSKSSKPSDVLITIASSDESSQGGMPQNQQTVSLLEDSDDDDASEGGFLRDSNVVTASDPKQLQVPIVARCEDGEAIASSNEDKQRLSDEGGGFLAETLVRGATSPEAIATRKGYDDDAISDEDDEDIAWEDGEGDSGSDRSNCAVKADGAADWFPNPEERTSNLPKGSTKSPPRSDTVSLRLEPNNRNQIALQQAQSTAANLTNWAGRAFRRAIAEQERLSNMPKEKMPDQKQTKAIADSTLNYHPVDVKRGGNQLIEIDDTSDGDDLGEDSRRSETSHDKVLRNDDKSIDCHDKVEVDDLTDVGKIVNHSNATIAFRVTDEKDSTNTSATGGNQSEFTAESLFEQEEELHKDLRRQEPDMDMMNDEMKAEIIALIELFGIPYVEAPAEAEAQCAALEALGLVDGIVTEDSDVFVFGGKTVYKNMFDDQKFVEVYKAEDAAKEMALNQNEMVALAMLLGGDYTSGVRGVGIVNSMEILGAFSMTKSTRDGLEQFRKWMDGFDPSDALASNSVRAEGRTALQKFHSTHRTARTRWICPEHFPAENVLNAYLNPIVDKSEDSFSWGKPDINKLINFCSQKMGWEASDTSRMLEPLSNRLKEGMRQTRLDMFMDYSDNIQFANVRSKRLRSVLQGVTQDQPSQATTDTNSAKKARK